MPPAVFDIAEGDRGQLSRPIGALDKPGLIGRRIGRKCDPQAVLDARQALAAASRTDRIDADRIVVKDEADAIAAGVIAAQVDLERNIERRAASNPLLRNQLILSDKC
jgi:hypothetical protein